MKYLFLALLFLVIGLLALHQSNRYSTAMKNGRDVKVQVLERHAAVQGAKSIRISWQGKEYWVDVVSETYNSAGLNQPILLQYDADNNVLVDKRNRYDLLKGVLFSAGSILFAGLYINSRRN